MLQHCIFLQVCTTHIWETRSRMTKKRNREVTSRTKTFSLISSAKRANQTANTSLHLVSSTSDVKADNKPYPIPYLQSKII